MTATGRLLGRLQASWLSFLPAQTACPAKEPMDDACCAGTSLAGTHLPFDQHRCGLGTARVRGWIYLCFGTQHGLTLVRTRETLRKDAALPCEVRVWTLQAWQRSLPRHRIALLAVVACLAALPSPAFADACPRTANELLGTSEADRLLGSDAADRVRSLEGPDRIETRGGDDRICSGEGGDEIDAGPGDDEVQAGAGDDQVWGGPGNDVIEAGRGHDVVDGGDGIDTCLGAEEATACERFEVPGERPTADAGPDIVTGPGIGVRLDGSASRPGARAPTSFRWSLKVAPEGSRPWLQDLGTPAPLLIPDRAGTYTLGLTLAEGLTESEPDEVSVIVSEDGPVPAWPESLRPVRLGAETALGPPPAQAWTLHHRPPLSARTSDDLLTRADGRVRFRPDAEGFYLLRGPEGAAPLLVADGTPPELALQAPRPDTLLESRPPSIEVLFDDRLSGAVPQSLRLVINGEEVQPTRASPAGASFAFPSSVAAGPVLLEASIDDRAGNRAERRWRLDLAPGPAVRAYAACAPARGPAPLTVRFIGDGSSAAGAIESYHWDFRGDGQVTNTAPVVEVRSHRFEQPGTFEAVLTVTDNLGNGASDRCRIQVDPPGPAIGTVSAEPSNGAVPLRVVLRCGAATGSSQIARVEWDRDGDGVFETPAEGSSGSLTTVYEQEGVFHPGCRLTDRAGLTAESSGPEAIVEVGPAGTPSVTAQASPPRGPAPLLTQLSGGVARNPGSITEWAWDVDGDGSIDSVSPSNANKGVFHSRPGPHVAILRVTDGQGRRSRDRILVMPTINASLEIARDSFVPSSGETALILTRQTATAPVRLQLRDAGGRTVRHLVEGIREAGTFVDAWDGRDDAGRRLPHGVYTALLELDTPAGPLRVDPGPTSGGEIVRPRLEEREWQVSPFTDELLELSFELTPQMGAATVTVTVGLETAAKRFLTLLDRVPLGVGRHTVYWDGYDQEGLLAIRPGDRLLAAGNAYMLPTNAILLVDRPVVASLTADPNVIHPVVDSFFRRDRPGVTVRFSLAEPSDLVFTVRNLRNGGLVHRRSLPQQPGGEDQTLSWDGRTEDGHLAAPGDYRLSLEATTALGAPSLLRQAVVRVFD